MSQLGQLKTQIGALAREAETTAKALAGYKTRFGQAIGQVNAVVGGSAQQIDKDMIATLQAAEKELQEAVNALQQASKAATSYAARL